jgi:hypothetical protein
MTWLDHLVIAASTVEEGVAYIKSVLGVDIPSGGKHPQMGTENHVMKLGNKTFLEVIAIDHNAAPPPYPRWFGLDDPFIRAELARSPRLLTWVVNTDNLAAVRQKSKLDIGNPRNLSRGELKWTFSTPIDGHLLAGGMAPYVIQWHNRQPHPSEMMEDRHCRLLNLEIHHPAPDWLIDILSSMDVLSHVTIKPLPPNTPPFLRCYISTPQGNVTLQGNQTGQKLTS